MTDLSGRMKFYEHITTSQRLIPTIPVCARIDGRAFHTWTRGLVKPYDMGMIAAMQDTTKFLMEETNAVIGYTQSDEISLIWHSDDLKSQIFFDCKIQKMASVLAALATARFNRAVNHELTVTGKTGTMPVFDARVWNMPDRSEAANYLVWREMDARRNSIQLLAQSYYSSKELHQKDATAMQDMIHKKGDNWNNHPFCFKRGTYIRRVKRERCFTQAELSNLPDKHEAKQNPELKILRTDLEVVEFPPFGRVQNKVAVIFEGADPVGHDLEHINE